MHPLQDQVAAARRRIRRLLLLYGIGRVVFVGLTAIAVLALADDLLRYDDRGVRWICSLALWGAIIWGVLRFLLPALRQPLRDTVVAGRIERYFSGHGNQLSSTIEFLHQREDDPLAGSAALRRAAVAQAEAEIAPLDWRAAIDNGPAWRAVAAACAIGLLGGVLVVARPADARIALARLANPLSNAAWPPTNDLQFVHRVDRVAFGAPFEVELKDRSGKLPEVVKIQYRTVGGDIGSAGGAAASDDASPKIETETMQRIGDLMVARKDRVARPFDYRAEGGDARKMAWIHVEVVQPPRIDSLAITLHPPAYTGWPAQNAERRIVALRGTAVEMSGRSNKALAAAVLHPPGEAPIAADVSPDGLTFSIPFAEATTENDAKPPATSSPAKPLRRSPRQPPRQSFVVERSGAYWFELRDREGLTGGDADRWDIQAVADEPPSVSITEPAANLLVTPAASINVRLTAKDDLALHTIGLVYTRSDRTDLGEIAMEPLYAGPRQAPAIATAAAPGMMPADSRTLDFTWQLAPLHFKPGTNLVLAAVAADYASQRTASSPRRISIITPEEFEDHLAARESSILNELSRLLKLEQSSRQDTASLQTQVERVGRLTKADLEQLRAEALNQRQIRRGLVGPTEGVRAMVVALLQELSGNHVDNPAMQRRMQAIADGLGRLDQNELPTAEQSLTEALKAAEDSPAPAALPPAGRHALDDAGRLQESIAATLESLLGDLAEWNSFRSVSRQLAQIRRDEADLQKATQAVGATTLTSDVQDLTPQQQADLKKLGDRQADLARQFDKLAARMEQVGGEILKSEPLSAQSLADALDVARREAPGARMSAASDNVAKNLLGKALAQQATAGASLDEMLDILANRRDQELSHLVAKLRDAEQQLSALRNEQEGLRKRMNELAASDPKANPAERKAELQRLSRQQRDLAQRSEQLVRQLQRLQAKRAADAAAQASSAMQKAGQSAENGNAAQAGESAAAAKKDLDDAQRQLADTRRQAEMDLAQQQLSRLEDSLKGLVDIQQRTIDDTVRLETLRGAAGELTRGQTQSVLDLARQQQALAADADQLATKLVAAETFQFVLQQASRDMTRTAARLSDRDTGPQTQQLEHDALDRLQNLVAALKQDQPPQNQNPQSANKNGQPGAGAKKQSDTVRSLAEVRLIRLMQDDLNRRTQRLDEAIGPGRAPTAEQRTEFAELTEEQGHLAELMVKLAGESSDDSSPEPKEQSR